MINSEIDKDLNTVETHIKEPVFIRNLRLKFHLMSPLNKNPKAAEMEMVLK